MRPGILPYPQPQLPQRLIVFNEAGAHAPRNTEVLIHRDALQVPSSMRPGHMRPGILGAAYGAPWQSL